MRESQLRLACLLLLPLLLQAPAHLESAKAPPTGPLAYAIYLPPGYYEYFPVYAFANSTVVAYTLASNASVSTAFMTAEQFQLFNDSNGPVSNSIAHHDGSTDSETVTVAPGTYYLLVYANGGAAMAALTLSESPNNPLGGGPLNPPQPTGIASFGLTNRSGVDEPYSVYSTDVIGLASISSMRALNATAGSVGANPSGATLQLNSMLVVEEEGGGSQVYWCQNTPDFVTGASEVAMSDNVWNASASGVLTNDSVSSQGGQGYVSTVRQNGTTLYFYAVSETNSTYALPLGLVLLMNATAEPGAGVLVRFGATATGDTLGTGARTDWFDNVTIHDPSAESAYFATDGNRSSPLGTFYDTELVFAGEGGGETTNFTSLSATLGLFYANGTSGSMNAFPSYFSFGQDTQEAADDLAVSYLGGGEARVTVGAPDYAYLGSASGALSLASVEASLGFPGLPSGATTTATALTSKTTTTASGEGAATATGPAGIPEFPAQAAAAAGLAALIAIAYLAVRRRAPSAGATKRL